MFGFSSAKGGVGVTVTAALTAAASRSSGSDEVLLVDLAGDLPAALGAPSSALGIGDWLWSTSDDAGLRRLESKVADGISLLCIGEQSIDRPLEAQRVADHVSVGATSTDGSLDGGFARRRALVALLEQDPRLVIVDLGHIRADEPEGALTRLLAERCARSYLVVRACYLGLRRATATAGLIRRDGVVLVKEPGRALRSDDVGRVLDLPVCAEIDLDPLIARSIDAGLILQRPPRAALRSVRHLL